jgi:putative transposase
MLPREYPPWQTVYYRLREAVREAESREPNPSGAVIEGQPVKSTGAGGPERGYQVAKRLSGRKCQLLVDTGALVLGAPVSTLPASTTATVRERS